MVEQGQVRVLCVDDEPLLLEGMERILGDEFDVVTADGGARGLDAMRGEAPFDVVISDMRMPGMDGAQFLSKARELSPDTTRVLLTGQADVPSAMSAINDGRIFRFLSKPCSRAELAATIHDAARLRRLQLAERELLEQTLRGSIQLLTELMSMVAPDLFRDACAVRVLARQAALELCDREKVWIVETAAMVAPIGLVTLPDDLVARGLAGRIVAAADMKAFHAHPAAGAKLLATIPRLGPVAEIVAKQAMLPMAQPNGIVEEGATILAIATRLERLVGQGTPAAIAAQQLAQGLAGFARSALEACLHAYEFQAPEQALRVAEVRVGMKVIDAVVSSHGGVLVAAGTILSAPLLERLRRLAENRGVREPLRVQAVMDAA